MSGRRVRRVQLFQVRDWTDGLNLRDDAFTLAANEIADCINVQVMPRGGVQRRKTCRALNGAAFTAARNIWQFLGNGVAHIIVQEGNDAAYSTGGTTFTAIDPDILTLTGRMRAASMARVSSANSERCYVQRNAEQVAWKWSGTAATVLADVVGGFNDNLAAPVGGKMPKAKYIAAHAGYLFHASTVEGGTSYVSRLRFSHPGEPEDYRTNDYVDIGVDDGDAITGLVSLGRVLFVFKSRSVWTVSGFSPDTFVVERVLNNVGATEQEAIAVAPHAVFFFDGAKGVFSINEQARVTWLWQKLAIRLADNTIPSAYLANVTLGWLDSRLFVATPWASVTTNLNVFVYDPQCGRNGAWYIYRYADGTAQAFHLGIGPMLEWRPNATTTKLLAIRADRTEILQLEYDNTANDIVDHLGATSTFTSSFLTAWFAAGMPGVRKRWRKPTFVFDADATALIGVNAYHNYSSTSASEIQNCQVTATLPSGGALWGSHNWGDGTKWGRAPSGEQQVVRCGSLGTAYAVQLRFTGPTNVRWGLNSIDFRYLPQRIK